MTSPLAATRVEMLRISLGQSAGSLIPRRIRSFLPIRIVQMFGGSDPNAGFSMKDSRKDICPNSCTFLFLATYSEKCE